MADPRTVVTWRGVDVVTLADLWPARPRAMIVGLHPVPCDVEAGRPLDGPVGRRQLARLADAGLFGPPSPGATLEAAAMSAGVGFAHVVPRPASGRAAGGAAGVEPAEIAAGRAALVDRIARSGVPLVVCPTRAPVGALLGEEGRPGYQERTLPGGARVFRMPSPFAPRAEVRAVLATLMVPPSG